MVEDLREPYKASGRHVAAIHYIMTDMRTTPGRKGQQWITHLAPKIRVAQSWAAKRFAVLRRGYHNTPIIRMIEECWHSTEGTLPIMEVAESLRSRVGV